MAKSREERKGEDRDRKSREIMDATMRLFSRKGYNGTTLEDIAQEMGYAKASLYYYFPSKESIVREMIMSAMNTAAQRMERLLLKSSDPVINLEDLIIYYIDDYTDQQGFFNIYHQVGPFMAQILSPEESLAMKKEMEAMNERIMGILKRGIAAGHFTDMDPQILGEMTLGMLSGLMNQVTHGFIKAMDHTELVKTITRIIIKGISK